MNLDPKDVQALVILGVREVCWFEAIKTIDAGKKPFVIELIKPCDNIGEGIPGVTFIDLPGNATDPDIDIVQANVLATGTSYIQDEVIDLDQHDKPLIGIKCAEIDRLLAKEIIVVRAV